MTNKKRIPYTTGQTQAEMDVLSERQRQIDSEQFTPKFDDDVNNDRELAAAAAAYAFGATYSDYTRGFAVNQAHSGHTSRVFEMWPASWDFELYKPTTQRRDLVKAAALCIAEIERLDRKVERDRLDAIEKAEGDASQEAEYGESKS